MFVGAGTRENVPFSFTQDRFKLGADYRGLEGVKLSAGADWDWRSRPYHEVVTTRETTVWGKAGVQAGEKLNLGFRLAKAQRTHSAYGVSTWFGAAENPLLRKYNLAERQRDTAGVRADIAATDTLSLGLSVDYANDGYAKSLVGLKNARSVNTAADLSLALSEKTRLNAYVPVSYTHLDVYKRQRPRCPACQEQESRGDQHLQARLQGLAARPQQDLPELPRRQHAHGLACRGARTGGPGLHRLPQGAPRTRPGAEEGH